MPPFGFMTIPEAARHLGVSRQRVHKLVELETLKIADHTDGGTPLIKTDDVEAYRDSDRSPGRPAKG